MRGSTSDASSTASPRARSGPDARLALADSYLEKGGPGNYILAVAGLPRVPDLLPLRTPGRLRAVPGRRRAYFQQSNSPIGTRPPRSRRSRSTSGSSTLYPNSSYVEQARERIRRVPSDPGRGLVHTWATSTRRHARPGERPSAATRACSGSTRTTNTSTTSSSAWARPWPRPPGTTVAPDPRAARGGVPGEPLDPEGPGDHGRDARDAGGHAPDRGTQGGRGGDTRRDARGRRGTAACRPGPPLSRGRGPTAGPVTSSVTLGNHPKSP